MTFYYYVCLYEVHGHTHKDIQEFVPAKTFARNVGSRYFGGFVWDQEDNRSFEELKNSDWVDGLQLLCGGNGIVTVRGADLYRTMQEIQDKLEELPIAVTKTYDTSKVKSCYQNSPVNIASKKKEKKSICCILL